jgi:glycosyltransferase involved in cell wall biosynthesis
MPPDVPDHRGTPSPHDCDPPRADPAPPPVASVVVPAHDEAAVLGRLLDRLVGGSDPGGEPSSDPGSDPGGRPAVVVVANACTDATAAVARGYPEVRVVETEVPGKRHAMRLGDAATDVFPRIYVDADVELGAADVRRLAETLHDGRTLATAPDRLVDRTGVAWPVRWYYDVWEQLPGVADGIFGRGVVALSAAGFERVAALPDRMADDLAMSAAFEAGERRLTHGAVVTVHPPRNWADLLRRRVRAATGTAQVYAAAEGVRTDSRTGWPDLLRIARRRPGNAPKVALFLAVAVLARRRAARAVAAGDYTTWLRDESSRTPDAHG